MCVQIPHYRSLLLMNKAVAAVGMWDLALSVTCAAECETVGMADMIEASENPWFRSSSSTMSYDQLSYFLFLFSSFFFSFSHPSYLFVCLLGKKKKKEIERGCSKLGRVSSTFSVPLIMLCYDFRANRNKGR